MLSCCAVFWPWFSINKINYKFGAGMSTVILSVATDMIHSDQRLYHWYSIGQGSKNCISDTPMIHRWSMTTNDRMIRTALKDLCYSILLNLLMSFYVVMPHQFSSTGQSTRFLFTSTGKSSGIWENDRTVVHQDEDGEASDFRLKFSEENLHGVIPDDCPVNI